MRLRDEDLPSYFKNEKDSTSPNDDDDDSCASDIKSTCTEVEVHSQNNSPPGSAQNPIYIQDDDTDTGNKTHQRILKLLAEGKLNLNVTPNMKRNLKLAVEIVKHKCKSKESSDKFIHDMIEFEAEEANSKYLLTHISMISYTHTVVVVKLI